MTILKSLTCSITLTIYLSLGEHNNYFYFIYSFIFEFLDVNFLHLISLFDLIVLLSQFSVISFVLFYHLKFVFIFPPPRLAFYAISSGKVFSDFLYRSIILTECVTTVVSKLCGIKWLLMSEDEITKESVIVQIKAER